MIYCQMGIYENRDHEFVCMLKSPTREFKCVRFYRNNLHGVKEFKPPLVFDILHREFGKFDSKTWLQFLNVKYDNFFTVLVSYNEMVEFDKLSKIFRPGPRPGRLPLNSALIRYLYD